MQSSQPDGAHPRAPETAGKKGKRRQKSLQKLHFSALHTSILSAENSSGSRNPKREKEMENEMASSKSNNLVNPNAREAMNRFKMEAASEVGVNLKQGYNGDLTSRQAGSIGGQMVKKMIAAYENGMQ
jgi:hypothetical protein